jgi:methylated-DNA-[protein]-cysteine S-methyltransferase
MARWHVLAVFGHGHPLPSKHVDVRIPPAEALPRHDTARMQIAQTEPIMDNVTFRIERFDTPTGRMLLVNDEQGRVRALDWETHEARMQRLMSRYYRNLQLTIREASQASAAKRAVLAYFDGDLEAIASVQVVTSGTEFQTDVWNALRRIPRGQTLSYGALAKDIGRPAAVRAVGLANGSNPIAIIVPCHRVIGANASLTGYGGGLERKRWLLDHESRLTSSAW